jgi:hypothetical protein
MDVTDPDLRMQRARGRIRFHFQGLSLAACETLAHLPKLFQFIDHGNGEILDGSRENEERPCRSGLDE